MFSVFKNVAKEKPCGLSGFTPPPEAVHYNASPLTLHRSCSIFQSQLFCGILWVFFRAVGEKKMCIFLERYHPLHCNLSIPQPSSSSGMASFPLVNGGGEKCVLHIIPHNPGYLSKYFPKKAQYLSAYFKLHFQMLFFRMAHH